MKAKYTDVQDAVVAFLRDELERRYLYENVCRFRGLKGMDPVVVEGFREFALRRIYPKGKARAKIDEAFASLHAIRLSPRKVASLGTVALAAMLRMGRRLTPALSAGELVVEVFTCASGVEQALAKAVVEKGIPWKAGLNAEDMKAAFAVLPVESYEALIDALVRLLEVSANHDTMKTGMELLQQVADTMSGGFGRWSDMDRRGITLAMDMLGEAMTMFAECDACDAARLIKGIATVERAWYKTQRETKRSRNVRR